jgi:hypothetical protein
MPVRAYVAVTDGEWYRFLAARSAVDEVNFWRPARFHLARHRFRNPDPRMASRLGCGRCRPQRRPAYWYR